MKKFVSLLLAALLCLSMLCVASAETTLTKVYSLENIDVISGSSLLSVETRDGYAMASLDGTLLTEAKYTNNFDLEYGYIYAYENTESFNDEGILRQDGSALTEFKYGDIDFLNECYALGIVLVSATADAFDYESYSDDQYWNIDTVDVIYLPEGKVIATLPRANYMDAYAQGDVIYIEDRTGSVVTAYDSQFNALGTVSSLYSSDYAPEEYVTFRANGQYGIQDAAGNQILAPSYAYIYLSSGYRGMVPVSDGEKEGMVDLATGTTVVPCEYDDVNYCYYSTYTDSEDYSYTAYGYFCVEKDGKLGYLDLQGNVTCEPKYAADNLDNNGCSATFTDMAGNFNILAADGVETPITGYQNVSPLYYGEGMFYRVTNEDYDYGMIDWHGNVVLPCEYDSIDLTGDGKYVIATTGYGDYADVYEITVTASSADKGKVAGMSGEKPAPAADEAVTAESAGNPAVAALLDSALSLLNADAAANGVAAASLLNSAAQLLTGNDAAISVLNSAAALLSADAAANAPSVITLIQTVQTMF